MRRYCLFLLESVTSALCIRGHHQCWWRGRLRLKHLYFLHPAFSSTQRIIWSLKCHIIEIDVHHNVTELKVKLKEIQRPVTREKENSKSSQWKS